MELIQTFFKTFEGSDGGTELRIGTAWIGSPSFTGCGNCLTPQTFIGNFFFF